MLSGKLFNLFLINYWKIHHGIMNCPLILTGLLIHLDNSHLTAVLLVVNLLVLPMIFLFFILPLH